MKTKISILVFLTVIIAVGFMVSCKKDAVSDQVSQNTNNQAHRLGLYKLPEDDYGTFAGYTPHYNCSGTPWNCLLASAGGFITAPPFLTGVPKQLMDSIARGPIGVSGFFRSSALVDSVFPFLLQTSESGNQDSILKSGHFYISVSTQPDTVTTTDIITQYVFQVLTADSRDSLYFAILTAPPSQGGI